DSESRLVYPADITKAPKKVLWLYREIERIFHADPAIERVVIKTNEYERLSLQQHDDIRLFALDELTAVSQSRFFEPVAGEPDLYAVKNDGLPLALGLALLGILRKEARNGRDPSPRLSEVIEPINALAATSDVVFSALQIACL